MKVKGSFVLYNPEDWDQIWSLSPQTSLKRVMLNGACYAWWNLEQKKEKKTLMQNPVKYEVWI